MNGRYPGAAAVLACLILCGGFSTATARTDEAADAVALFKAGKFAEAEAAYLKIAPGDPSHYKAVFHLGYIALLSNRLDQAKTHLAKALEMKPDDPGALSLMAEVLYRQDDLAGAAPFFKAAGRTGKAAQLESFKDAAPYAIAAGPDTTSLKFVVTDPLPVVEVRVNGGKKVNFFIDTGGAELILDPEFAAEAGVSAFGSETGTFAGGKKSDFRFGRADAVTLGDFTVRNVPVHLMPVRQMSEPVFGGLRVDGIVGTVLLYHFLPTIDYAGGRLVLRLRTPEAAAAFANEIRGRDSVAVPFWMAGDHFIVAWGTVNKGRPLLFFVDTGLAGGGFTCPESTIREAGIELPDKPSGEGIGGGGKVQVFPFTAERLSFGGAEAKDVQGIFSGPFAVENAFGFRIGGLISHGFFRPYAVTFDFDAMRITLVR